MTFWLSNHTAKAESQDDHTSDQTPTTATFNSGIGISEEQRSIPGGLSLPQPTGSDMGRSEWRGSVNEEDGRSSYAVGNSGSSVPPLTTSGSPSRSKSTFSRLRRYTSRPSSHFHSVARSSSSPSSVNPTFADQNKDDWEQNTFSNRLGPIHPILPVTSLCSAVITLLRDL